MLLLLNSINRKIKRFSITRNQLCSQSGVSCWLFHTSNPTQSASLRQHNQKLSEPHNSKPKLHFCNRKRYIKTMYLEPATHAHSVHRHIKTEFNACLCYLLGFHSPVYIYSSAAVCAWFFRDKNWLVVLLLPLLSLWLTVMMTIVMVMVVKRS